MEKRIKKIFIFIIVLFCLILLKIVFKVTINHLFIKDYPNKEQEYRLKLNSFINLYEPYIMHYNYGNYLFQKQKYDDAYIEYQKALQYEMPVNAYCKVNTNIAMTLYNKSQNLNSKQKKMILEEASEYVQKCLMADDKPRGIKLSLIFLIINVVLGIIMVVLVFAMKTNMHLFLSNNIEYIKRLEKLKKEIMYDDVLPYESCKKLNSIISLFIEKNTKINISNLSKNEIRKLGIHGIDLLMECYRDTFDNLTDKEIYELIDKTMEVIKKWNWK